MQLFLRRLFQAGKRRLQRRVIGAVALAFGSDQKTIGIKPVFHEHDGRARMRRAQGLHRRMTRVLTSSAVMLGRQSST